MAVVRKTIGGSYVLAELDGALSALRYAAFRLVPYHARTKLSVPITRIVEEEPSETNDEYPSWIGVDESNKVDHRK